MIDRLSIPNLLKLLVFNQKDVFFRYEHADPDDLIINSSQYTKLASNVGHRAKADVVRQLCEREEALRKLNRHTEAIAIATEASQIAHDAYDHNLQGIALLHLSAARASTGRSDLDKQAIRDCNRAIRDFCLEPHNHAIALAIRAQIHRQINQDGDSETSQSYLRQASRALERIIEESHGLSTAGVCKVYRELKDSVDEAINALVKSRAEIMPLPIAPKLVNRSTAPRPKTINMLSDAVQVLAQRSIPILNISARAGTPIGEYADYSALDYIEIADQISLFGRPYTLHWPDNTNQGHRTLQLRVDREYAAVLVDGESMLPTLHPGEYVLVRKQDYHEFDGQLVVATLGSQGEGDPTESIVKRARGYPHIKWLESDNPRRAKYPQISPNNADLQLRLFGIVEAILKPVS